MIHQLRQILAIIEYENERIQNELDLKTQYFAIYKFTVNPFMTHLLTHGWPEGRKIPSRFLITSQRKTMITR